MPAGERLVVDAVDDRGVHIRAARSGDDHLLRSAREVRGRLGLAGEQPGALQHVLHPELAPRELGGIALGKHADSIAIDEQRIPIHLDFAGEAAVDGIVLRQMRIGFGVTKIVEGDDLDFPSVLALVKRAQHVATDAAVAVDTHLDCHDPLSSWLRG